MLIYKMDVLKALKAAGYNSNRLRTEKLLGESAMQALREGQMIGPKTLDALCGLLQMQPGDIIEYVTRKDTHDNN